MPTAAMQKTYPYGGTNRWLVLFIATIGIYGCSNDSKCEDLMAKLFSARSSEFISGGCIDNNNAYLYPYAMHNALMFASISKDTFATDSVIDFNHSFAKYANMEELKQAIYGVGNEYDKIVNHRQYLLNEKYRINYANLFFKHNIDDNTITSDLSSINSKPIIYRKKDYYQLVNNYGIYRISFQNKEFVKILELKQGNSRFQNEVCFRPVFRYKKINFSQEYTEITLNNSHITLHENGELAVNVEPGYCLYVKRLNPKEEIITFGADCIIKENCEY